MNEDEPRVWCRHLLLCRNIWYDPNRMDDGFSLGKLLVQVRPAEGDSYPIVSPRLFAFVQLAGEVGSYSLSFRLLRIGRTDLGEEVEEQLGAEEEPLTFGPWTQDVVGEEYVESAAFPLANVRLLEGGEYEVQLLVGENAEEPLFRERFYAIQ